MFNLLTQPVLRIASGGAATLPALLAALARDEVESFPALRPHQEPAWHMFLVQLAALALRDVRDSELPSDEAGWVRALRSLTPDFENDEPWCLVVEDSGKPAFLQPPVPKGVNLGNPVATPDALDLLITSRNHDLKQNIAYTSQVEDWVFALVSLQTGEGYGGAGNHGIARMNGGSSSRSMLVLAPLPTGGLQNLAPRPGARFCRDVGILLKTRDAELGRHHGYAAHDGLGLTWVAPWPEEKQLQLADLDLWFIEACRRVRLSVDEHGRVSARKGTSKATRINAKERKGVLGDPFAPVHKVDAKSFTLGSADFDYRKLTELLLSGNWELPLLAQPTDADIAGGTLALIAQAMSRGNSKTEGFKSRILPIAGKPAKGLGAQRAALYQLAQMQMEDVDKIDKALSGALALLAAGGDFEKRNKGHYAHAAEARRRFNCVVDRKFFEHLWRCFAVQDGGADALREEALLFVGFLVKEARRIFDTSLSGVPCAGIIRPRAEARAKDFFSGYIRKHFPELIHRPEPRGAENAA